MRLINKVTIVTGAATGIGRAIALRFAQEGSDIVIVDLLQPEASRVAEEVNNLGRRAAAIKADVSNVVEVSMWGKGALCQGRGSHWCWRPSHEWTTAELG
jgi:NAD(P)-dependent dehydrogenase (short-subunit alcohol dehydrogenase family)